MLMPAAAHMPAVHMACSMHPSRAAAGATAAGAAPALKSRFPGSSVAALVPGRKALQPMWA